MEKNLIQESTIVKRIVICGPESTGKSTLTKNLANYFNTSFAKEYARDFLQDKWDRLNMVCTKEDLISIVKGQTKNENEATLKAKKFVFCDTNILTTIAWSKTHFNGFCDNWIIEQSKKLNLVECAKDGFNNKRELCEAKGITGFPSWEINGSIDSGVKSLEELAELSNYKDSTDF